MKAEIVQGEWVNLELFGSISVVCFHISPMAMSDAQFRVAGSSGGGSTSLQYPSGYSS